MMPRRPGPAGRLARSPSVTVTRRTRSVCSESPQLRFHGGRPRRPGLGRPKSRTEAAAGPQLSRYITRHGYNLKSLRRRLGLRENRIMSDPPLRSPERTDTPVDADCIKRLLGFCGHVTRVSVESLWTPRTPHAPHRKEIFCCEAFPDSEAAKVTETVGFGAQSRSR